MTLNVVGQARPNTFAFETSALIKTTGLDLTAGKNVGRKLKVVAACGNGTAVAFRRTGSSSLASR
ncbi:hypothetical protein [Mesorhizobium sp. M0913]|uniref:hypothetical protein n=1 Tax=unclassified Mesorhizobium TaxID=325217 RepID=UPI003337A5C4